MQRIHSPLLALGAIYLVIGLALGLHMGASHDFRFAPVHAHINLVGFVLHSGWSFKGHGSRDPSGRQHIKFLLVQGFGMLLNMAFTWVLTGPLHQATWVPLIPVVLVTPFATFALNRQWVFA